MRFLSLILSVVILASCNTQTKQEYKAIDNATAAHKNMHKVMVKEVLQTSSYSYLLVNEAKSDFWIATSKSDVKTGSEIYYTKATKMVNFNSKELNRVFETLYLVDAISDKPISTNLAKQASNPHKTTKQKAKGGTKLKQDVKIDAIKGGITIAELYKNKTALSGKKILIKGKVIKVNKNIIDRNWIHIQDGSQFESNYSLTITSKELVKVGDIVTFEGIVTLDKKFGAGYSYELIVEEAVVK
ncbi:MAG: hypothetical protein COB98_04925 [Flavobacteriaceae bacterium]|nr:MAG: hypothetical protein COB98_04925 [Flavobacteriaceae bacterium]